ncbi:MULTISPECIES: FxsC protein [unclassified Frankia]|uniref:FxsC protein n=1 Tax=unclassified Frankia TaxID=2632575 RepID=UPI000A4F054F|nr:MULTISPECIES: FxsC protein [unclassified Frankia]
MTRNFVLHHAGTPGEDRYAEQFLDDIQDEVDRAVGTGAGDTESIRGRFTRVTGTRFGIPADGSQVIDPVILSCVALVSLNTDGYLRDQQRMWERRLFRERLRWHLQFTGRASPAHIGVRWFSDAASPAPTTADALIDADLGPEYATTGALRLLRTAPESESYRRLVVGIARRILDAAHDPVPVMSEEDVRFVPRIPTAASAGAPPGVPSPPAWERSRAGGGRATVVLAVPAQEDLPPERRDRGYYGRTAAEWRPFLPGTGASAFDVVRATMEDVGIHDIVCEQLSVRMFENPPSALDDERVVAVLVDPWIASGGNADDALARLAEWRRRSGAVVGIFLITAEGDEETAAQAAVLTNRLRHLLKEDAALFRSRTWLPAVDDAARLASSARPFVVRARNRLLAERRRAALVSSAATGGPATDRLAPERNVWARPYHRMWMSDAADTTRPASHRTLGAGVETA